MHLTHSSCFSWHGSATSCHRIRPRGILRVEFRKSLRRKRFSSIRRSSSCYFKLSFRNIRWVMQRFVFIKNSSFSYFISGVHTRITCVTWGVSYVISKRVFGCFNNGHTRKTPFHFLSRFSFQYLFANLIDPFLKMEVSVLCNSCFISYYPWMTRRDT